MSSWIWGADDTVDQANLVVQSLQSELDERQATIEALERALRREKQQHLQDLRDEVEELRQRRQALAREMLEVDVLLASKEAFLNGTLEKKPKSSKPKPAAEPAPSPPPSDAPSTSVPEPEAEVAPAATPEATPLPCNPELTKVRGVDPSTAFIIQRSNNANTVVYKGNLGSASRLDPKNPLHIYWIMYAQQGPPYPTEELNMIERNTAYGATCSPGAAPHEYDVALASLKDRAIVLLHDGHHVRARTTINGRPNVYLERVYVQSTTSWGLPKVEFVEIFGVDPATNALVYEKKLP
ncbi:hypothetical protein SDRG_15211 [Saprolegnia diclina VS20]|uniref:DUF4833 domain-containing protein n=1 Tax=Saprolegnia diclina (strain VS20) TaxID=1156394 RepID=T0R4K9_SAPDV|nr:hypothetical protein SDRG_15211 [Saprolegnia diclina VS20]EQC26998.1 hypothetical protein SDRG_15211 [Saprolegnia diclina VS20]|eukprot:XP_008619600.1 hypothetical protein SDRG_15211 [Saprolegnia diclina VS20]